MSLFSIIFSKFLLADSFLYLDMGPDLWTHTASSTIWQQQLVSIFFTCFSVYGKGFPQYQQVNQWKFCLHPQLMKNEFLFLKISEFIQYLDPELWAQPLQYGGNKLFLTYFVHFLVPFVIL